MYMYVMQDRHSCAILMLNAKEKHFIQLQEMIAVHKAVGLFSIL